MITADDMVLLYSAQYSAERYNASYMRGPERLDNELSDIENRIAHIDRKLARTTYTIDTQHQKQIVGKSSTKRHVACGVLPPVGTKRTK